ncbi:SH3 domain-containing kinase-binding protein 1 [Channa argus]|uniref:SH3 domain-containing kinase-binding protein 1 n=1 Tax=Channa argus TaxID=215402 RepID=UPI00351FF812
MGNYSSALNPDTEEFVSIVSVTEKLNEQAAHGADERLQSELQTLVTLMEEGKENQSKELDSLLFQNNSQETNQNGSALSPAEAINVPPQSFSLLSKVLSSVLHPTMHPGLNSDPEPIRNPAKPTSLEHLQTELRHLRNQIEQMNIQHNKEIKQLMNELDEEKKIRLTLQMEIQRMKKHIHKCS